MINEHAIKNTILKTNSIAAINFSAAFVVLSVALPWFTHQFNVAGQVFLPMHFFVLFAGLLLGWRTGLIVGIITPLISYALSGMPVLSILPQITLEVACYGLIAGLMRERLKLNLYWSLFIGLFAGRIALLIGIIIFNNAVSQPLASIFQSVNIGWPGLIIQLSIIPVAVFYVKRYFEKHDHQASE